MSVRLLAVICWQAGRHFHPHLVEPFLHMLATEAETKKQAVAQLGNGL